MGIRPVQLRSRIRQFHGRSQPLGLRTCAPCGREGEGPHLPPVPETLNGWRRRHAEMDADIDVNIRSPGECHRDSERTRRDDRFSVNKESTRGSLNYSEKPQWPK